MLIPKFSCRQDAQNIYIIAKIPHVKISDLQVIVDDRHFSLCVKPYLLSLTFSHSLHSNEEREVVKYDVETEEIQVVVPKETPGTEFLNLDMVTNLLTPKDKGLIEELGMDETIAEDKIVEDHSGGPYYGFNDEFCGFFTPLDDEATEIVDIPKPDAPVSPDGSAEKNDRVQQRIDDENNNFNFEHYAMNFILPEEFHEATHFKPFWAALAKLQEKKQKAAPKPAPKKPLIVEVDDEDPMEVEQPSSSTTATTTTTTSNNTAGDINDLIQFSEEEFHVLKDLPKKTYLVVNKQKVAHSLLDILLAYTYDHRTTLGTPTPESGWTISKLSATLSWLHSFESTEELLVSFMRRSLCFPLYRNWELSLRCVSDVVKILQCGRKAILRALLSVKWIFGRTEWKYLLCKLYIDPYLVWLQGTDTTDAYWATVATALKKQKKSLSKENIGINLAEVESWAKEHEHELYEEEVDPLESERPQKM
eukprot:TRINITY_DN68072_c8_g9_i1.p1 TRINITY_DN68072_c8_g9~~TRINITY_DN68072_c8_g9_i1.p1  ORF type:complete len:477 (-),score=66.49 TRINITY_DN68072_c8_g9_i1:266-1696(-)